MKVLAKCCGYLFPLLCASVIHGQTLHIQGQVKDRTSERPIAGASVSTNVRNERQPVVSQSDGTFVLDLINIDRAGAVLPIFVTKDGYTTASTVCPVLSDPYLCGIGLDLKSASISAKDIDKPNPLSRPSTQTPIVPHRLQLSIAGTSFEELKFFLASSGQGRFSVNRMFLKLVGYEDCRLGTFAQFAPVLGTPAYWINLSPEFSEYDLYPQDPLGSLATWIYKDQDEGQFWLKLTGQKNRLYVATINVEYQDLEHGNARTETSKPFQYFYTSDGVSPECVDISKWYRPNLLKQPKPQKYEQDLDLESYQLLTADLKYSGLMLDKAGGEKLYQLLPKLRRAADYNLYNKAFNSNVSQIAAYVEHSHGLSFLESMFYTYGRLPSPPDLPNTPENADAIKAFTVPEYLKLYTSGFVYQRMLAYRAYDAALDSGKWDDAVVLMDKAVAAGRKSIVDRDDDSSFARQTFPVLLYDDACSNSRRGNISAAKSLLLEAIGMGFHEYDLIRSDPDLTALKSADPQAFEQMLKSSVNP
jgi:hypothetical protein